MCCSYLSELQLHETGGEKLYTCLPLSSYVISTVAHSDVICAVNIAGVKCQLATLRTKHHLERKKGSNDRQLINWTGADFLLPA